MTEYEVYEVTVDNVGIVYRGINRCKAHDTYQAAVELSKLSGRCAGESVYLMVNGEIQSEYVGSNCQM